MYFVKKIMPDTVFSNSYYPPNCTFPFFTCFFLCLPDKAFEKDGITYDEAVFYAIDEDSDFYANDGDWEVYWSDEGDDDFSDDERL